jgi:hypothetical protein
MKKEETYIFVMGIEKSQWRNGRNVLKKDPTVSVPEL